MIHIPDIAAEVALGHEPVIKLIPRRCLVCRNLWRDLCCKCESCPECMKKSICPESGRNQSASE